MVLETNTFFVSPAFSICQVFDQTVQIFLNDWGTYMMLSFLQLVSMFPVIIVCVLIISALFVAETMALMGALGISGSNDDAVFSPSSNGGFGGNIRRFLEDWGQYTGDSSSEFPSNNYGTGDGTDDFANWDFGSDVDQNDPSAAAISALQESGLDIIITVFLVAIPVGIVLAAVASTFYGAIVHATADSFAGKTPNWKHSLGVGWKKKCTLLCYTLIVNAAGVAVFLVCLGLAALLINENNFIGIIVLFILLSFVMVGIVSSALMAGTMSIIVERSSFTSALTRSWNLTKSSLCFIFCSIFCFSLVELFCSGAFKAVLGALLTMTNAQVHIVIMTIVSAIINMAIIPLSIIVRVVIYFSLRIRFEGLTQTQLAHELGEGGGSLGIEMGGGKDGRPYAIASVMEDDTSETFMDEKEDPVVVAKPFRHVV